MKYAVSLAAFKAGAFHHKAASLDAVSDAAAYSTAMAFCGDAYPKSQGWTMHSVAVDKVNEEVEFRMGYIK